MRQPKMVGTQRTVSVAAFEATERFVTWNGDVDIRDVPATLAALDGTRARATLDIVYLMLNVLGYEPHDAEMWVGMCAEASDLEYVVADRIHDMLDTLGEGWWR